MKVFIDIFIGIWAFILAYIWTNHINRGRRDKAKRRRDLAAFSEVHHRLRRDLRGRALRSRSAAPAGIAAKLPPAIGEANMFRVIFFILTFFSIGVLSNFRKLWQEGIGKLAAVYVVSLFGFVIWVGLADFLAVLRRRQAAARELK